MPTLQSAQDEAKGWLEIAAATEERYTKALSRAASLERTLRSVRQSILDEDTKSAVTQISLALGEASPKFERVR
jgi:hypothetical protein